MGGREHTSDAGEVKGAEGIWGVAVGVAVGGRVGGRGRAFAIARGETVEAAIEIAAACGSASDADVERVAVLADRLVALLTRLIR